MPDTDTIQPTRTPSNGQAAAANGAAPARQLAVPERPRLAPGVRTAGRMEESAFEEPPWLLEREGAGYVQVTELLHRIAEACDGQQTLTEIAERVSEQTGRSVNTDNVRQLIATQLMLKGLVQTDDGKVVGAAGGSRSMLGLQAKAKVVAPEAIDPVARVLQFLFWPPVLVAALVATVLAQGWLFFIHGVAAGTRTVLEAPGLLLPVLAATALAAGFHELGHAAALRYGDGRAKSMGVGLYLVYPAFYTDVSDNYRLTRWPRIRTDLGGVYFHLLFALGLMGVWVLTSWEFLLVIVVLLNLDAARQLLPLLRLDGYWVLADLTGVPDFWSRMGPFLRRVLPIGGDEAAKLPRLKWWGTLAFALYALLAIPLVVFLLLTMLRSVPRMLATAWASSQQLGATFGQAQAGGDIAGMAAAGGQVLLLALPTLALVYAVLRLGWRLATGVWRWSQPTPTRRMIGAGGSVLAVGLLAYLWAPSLPFGAPGQAGPLYSDVRANFVPIRPEDRGTLGEAWAPAPRLDDPPRPATTPEASPQPAATPEGVPSPVQAGASPAATLAPTTNATAAVTSTSVLPAAIRTSAPQGVSPVAPLPVLPTAVGTPLPAADQPTAAPALTSGPASVPTSATPPARMAPTAVPSPTR